MSATRHWVLLLIIIEHMRQDVLGILQPLRHLRVIAIKSLVQRHSGSFALLIDVGHIPVF